MILIFLNDLECSLSNVCYILYKNNINKNKKTFNKSSKMADRDVVAAERLKTVPLDATRCGDQARLSRDEMAADDRDYPPAQSERDPLFARHWGTPRTFGARSMRCVSPHISGVQSWPDSSPWPDQQPLFWLR